MRYKGFIFKIKINRKIFDEVYKKYSNSEEMKTKKVSSGTENTLYGIHPDILEKCIFLYKSGSLSEAVEKSFKVVKDRLRNLTGFESGSDAFGIGKLYIKGASAPNVDDSFNKAVKFLAMAIDNFRNEKSHTANANITDPERAYQYLVLSSLALTLLDNSEIK